MIKRLLGLFRRGEIESGTQQQATVKFGSVTFPDVPRLEPYGFTSSPKEGQKACVYMPLGEANNALVFEVQGEAMPLESPGDVAMYNDGGQSITLSSQGISIDCTKIAIKAGTQELLALLSDLIDELANLPPAILTGTSPVGPLAFPTLTAMTLDVKLRALKARLDAMRLE